MQRDAEEQAENGEKVYKTEVTGVDGEQEEEEAKSPKAKMQHYEVAHARAPFEAGATVTDANLEELKVPDYDAYFGE